MIREKEKGMGTEMGMGIYEGMSGKQGQPRKDKRRKAAISSLVEGRGGMNG